MLQLRRDLVDQVVAHARRDHPDEACGLLVGPAGADRAERFVPMLNAARSPTYYQFDEAEWLQVYRDVDAADEEIVAVFHSHTATEAYPSRTDVGIADNYALFLASPHYLLVSTREADSLELRSYRIQQGDVTEEPVEVVESYRFANTGPDDQPDS